MSPLFSGPVGHIGKVLFKLSIFNLITIAVATFVGIYSINISIFF